LGGAALIATTALEMHEITGRASLRSNIVARTLKLPEAQARLAERRQQTQAYHRRKTSRL
jgi:hypothetical protein